MERFAELFQKGKLNGYCMRYDRSANMWYLEWYNDSRYTEHKGYQEILSISPSDLHTYDYTGEFVEYLEYDELVQVLSDLGKDIFVKKWSTRGYSQGDYVEGFAFVQKNDTLKWLTQIQPIGKPKLTH